MIHVLKFLNASLDGSAGGSGTVCDCRTGLANCICYSGNCSVDGASNSLAANCTGGFASHGTRRRAKRIFDKIANFCSARNADSSCDSCDSGVGHVDIATVHNVAANTP